VLLVLTKLLFSDLQQELLSHSVTFEVPLYSRCVLILVQFYDVKDVTVVARSAPSFLEPGGSFDPILKHVHVEDFADHTTSL